MIKQKSEAALAREQALNDKISFLKILYRPKHIKRVADAIERDEDVSAAVIETMMHID